MVVPGDSKERHQRLRFGNRSWFAFGVVGYRPAVQRARRVLSWKGGGDQLMDNYWDSGNREIAFNNKPSKEGRDMEKAQAVFDYSSALVGYKPTPTIKKLDTEAMAAPAR